MEMNFCRRCGSPLEKKSEGFYQCINLHDIFIASVPSMGVLFLKGDSILLSKRRIEPGMGLYDAPGGFLEPGESFIDALYREVEEELGLKRDAYDEPRFLCSAPSVYQYQDEDKPVIGVMYTSVLNPNVVITPSDDSAGVITTPLEQIDFDTIYGDDTKYAIRLLQQNYKERIK